MEIDVLHVITNKGKWGVYKSKNYRSLRNFKHRDLAFHYATRFKKKVIVHNEDGMVDFIYDYEKESKILG